MKREIKVLGYLPRGSCAESKSYPMEEKAYLIEINKDPIEWFIELCEIPRSDFDFIPCVMLNEKIPKSKPSLWGCHG